MADEQLIKGCCPLDCQDSCAWFAHVAEGLWSGSRAPRSIRSREAYCAPRCAVGVEAGIPEEVIGRLINHASKTITGQRYVKPKLDFLRSAMHVVVEELERRMQPISYKVGLRYF